MPFTTFIGIVPLGDRGADDGVRTLDLVVDRLADVVEQAAHLGDLDVGADLARRSSRRGGCVSIEWWRTFWP